MPQLELTQAQQLILRVVENPDDPQTQAIPERLLIQAIATVLVRNELLSVPR